MAKEKRYYIGVKALIANSDGKLLLMKTIAWHGAKAHWDIQGGCIQQGQTSQETLLREIEEETDITEVSDMEFTTAVVSNIEITITDSQKVRPLLVVYGAVIRPNAQVTLSEEHVTYEWVEPKVAAKRLTRKYPKEFIQKLQKLH